MDTPAPTPKLPTILLVISAFCFFTTALLAYQNTQLQSQISLLESNIASKPKPTPNICLCPDKSACPKNDVGLCPEKLPTADWETYFDTKFGFELKTPKDWKVEQNVNKNFSYLIRPKNHPEKQDFLLSLDINNNPQKLTAKNFVYNLINRYGPPPEGKVEETRLNGIAAMRITKVSKAGGSEEEIFVSNDKYIYQFNFPVAEMDPTIFDPIRNNEIAHQILSTLKFLNNTGKLCQSNDDCGPEYLCLSGEGIERAVLPGEIRENIQKKCYPEKGPLPQ